MIAICFLEVYWDLPWENFSPFPFQTLLLYDLSLPNITKLALYPKHWRLWKMDCSCHFARVDQKSTSKSLLLSRHKNNYRACFESLGKPRSLLWHHTKPVAWKAHSQYTQHISMAWWANFLSKSGNKESHRLTALTWIFRLLKLISRLWKSGVYSF